MQGAYCDAVRALLAAGNAAERRLWKSEITIIYWGLLSGTGTGVPVWYTCSIVQRRRERDAGWCPGWHGLEQGPRRLFKTPTDPRPPLKPGACAEKRAGFDATPL